MYLRMALCHIGAEIAEKFFESVWRTVENPQKKENISARISFIKTGSTVSAGLLQRSR